MVKQVQLEHNTEFSCQIICNEKLIGKKDLALKHDFNVPVLPAHIKIEIYPWKIQPIIRYDGIMVNYGLAKITPWDHMLEFSLTENFLDSYFTQIVESKKDYLQVDYNEIIEIMGLKIRSGLVKEILNNIK